MTAPQGRTTLVTGGSRGIGRAISQRLGRDGALVAVHYGTNDDAADATVADIEADGGKAFAIQALLGQPGDIETLFQALDTELHARTGSTHLDVVVNNAGIVRNAALAGVTTSDYEETFALNVRAPLFVTQAAVERMGDGGRVITISSAVTHKAWPEAVVYSMSKGAINVMTRTLAKELAPKGITINAVTAGLIDTDLNSSWLHSSPEVEAMAASYAAFNRLGVPQDIADVVAFFASDDSRWVTGQHLDASGGTNL